MRLACEGRRGGLQLSLRTSAAARVSFFGEIRVGKQNSARFTELVKYARSYQESSLRSSLSFATPNPLCNPPRLTLMRRCVVHRLDSAISA